MAGSFSDYAENKILELLVGKTGFATPTCYVALCTSAPTDASTGATIVEPSTTGTAYARKSTAAGDWNAAASNSISNSADITFATATGAGWGTVTHFALVDNGTVGAGQMLAWGSLNVSKAISAGDTASFKGGSPGDLSLTID